MKAVLYSRACSCDQKESIKKLRYQNQTLSKYCKKHGIMILKSYSDICGSESSAKPGMKSLFDGLKSGTVKPDLLICSDLYRLARTIDTYTKIIELLKEYSVDVRITNEVNSLNHILQHFDLLGYGKNSHSKKIKEGIKAKKARINGESA